MYNACAVHCICTMSVQYIVYVHVCTMSVQYIVYVCTMSVQYIVYVQCTCICMYPYTCMPVAGHFSGVYTYYVHGVAY